MDPLLFIHLPKTAGTSLNDSAVEIFGHAAIEKDYGADDQYSTDLTMKFIHGPHTIDQHGFFEAFKQADKKWLTGHFHAERYIHLFGAANSISFLRDPVERVISEYHYLVYKHNLNQSFEDFYRSDAETNKQYIMLGTIPWRALHLVGTQQYYSDCVKLLSQSLNFPFKEKKSNVRPISHKPYIDNNIRSDIKKWNERDYHFYHDVQAYLTKRLSTSKCQKIFCYHDTAFIPDRHIIGWAFYEGNDQIVNIGLFIDDDLRETVEASEHRPELQLIHTPRMGHNGFRFVLEKYKEAKNIKVLALNTGQCLLDWVRP